MTNSYILEEEEDGHSRGRCLFELGDGEKHIQHHLIRERKAG